MHNYLTNGWQDVILPQIQMPYFAALKSFLEREYAAMRVNPAKRLIFAAFDNTPREKVRVVILGQDPYPDSNAAMGLCFSVPQKEHIAPSLVNIFKEIESDLGRPSACASTGNLTAWAQQGVLLLNTVLTCRAGAPNSHRNIGWETFTDSIIKSLNGAPAPLVFILWGRQAQDKRLLLTNPAHLILTAPHPSPLSAYAGFFGCRHFSQANEFLQKNNSSAIDW